MPPPTFNLKQRLAALSNSAQTHASQFQSHAASTFSSSSSSSQNNGHASGSTSESYSYANSNSSTSTISKARALFANGPPNWMKRSSSEESPYASYDETYVSDHDKRMVQDVLAKMIFQAGVDFETRPMVVLNASALPDPQQVSYDLLLARILSYLNLYVEADYTVVFFAAGSRHAPSWNWVWKAYRSLSRKYRKNLKQLYIVHSSFFSKMLFSLAGAIISPKFFRKIVYVQTLSELATRVPLTQIDIPPAVYQENLKYERKITLPIPVRSNVFGVPLEDIMGYNGEKGGVPRVVKDAIQFLRESGLQDEGLFRRSPASSLLRSAQDAYDRGQVVSLHNFGDPHLAAVLLKKYLRDLPEPIFPESMYAAVRRCPVPNGAGDEEGEMASVQYVREVLLPELVPCAYILLSNVIHLLHDVSLRSSSNRMDATNLAIVICPNLVKSSNPMRDVMMCSVAPGGAALTAMATQNGQAPRAAGDTADKCTLGLVIALCIRRYYEIFDEVVDRSEAVAPWKALGARNTEGMTNGDGEPMYVLDDGEEEDDSFNEETAGTPTGHGPSRQGAPGMGTTVKRHRTTLSNASNSSQPASARSLFADTSNTTHTSSGAGKRGSGTFRAAPPPPPKARSVISVESSSAIGGGAHSKRGSIAIGRGTTRKGSGAAVEAIGVTAAGFFSPPSGTSATPASPTTPTSVVTPRRASLASASSPPATEAPSQEEDEPRLSVGERRRMFEGQK